MNEFSFEIENAVPPCELIEQYFIPVIQEKTHNYLFAAINDYKGNIMSYETVESPFGGITSFMTKERTVYHDIQNDLGDLHKEQYTYELFIGSNVFENYKYRLLFFRHGLAGYPVKVVLADAISREIKLPVTIDKPYIYKINNMKMFDEMIKMILDSKTLYSVMQEAINISILEKRRRDDNKEKNMKTITSLVDK